MEVVNPFSEEFQDMKICRLCGSNNKENIDIFTSKPISSRSEDLLTKILTVYPMVLYKDDPLPQHICPKCIGNVSTTYQDIQQVMRQQNKWMSLTKAVQPEHKYFHILKMVEKSTTATKENIKTTYNIEINNMHLGKFLHSLSKENQNNTVIKTTNSGNDNEIVVKNIQNKLESNGFTIKRIKVPPSTNNDQDHNSNYSDNIDLEISDNIVTCNYCRQEFSNFKTLAQHQLIHLKLTANKIFQKHLLPSQLRRGRLITLNDVKCIRCLNCWRIYNDNKTILQHWAGSECEFYCFVCGKEFPHSPKMLREHVLQIHGLSYRSIKTAFISGQKESLNAAFFTQTSQKTTSISIHTDLKPAIVKKVYKKPPPKSCTKNDDGTITCKICYKVFDNFRSSNSHMRKHKPPVRKPSVNTTSILIDKYNTEDDYEAKPTTSNPYFDKAAPSNTMLMKPLRPAYRVIMKNGPLRGIKTKIVQKRQDFLTNFATNNYHHLSRSLSTSTPITNDNDNLIVPELLTSIVKSEPLSTNDSPSLGYGGYANNPLTQTIKSEPVDDEDYLSNETRLCFICNEGFLNRQDYQLHAMFVHNIN